jgi:Kef-type K+ transport system membrane component KefB
MEETFRIAAIWLSLAVAATVLANHLRISIALVEICMGVTAGAVAVALGKADLLGFNSEWLRFLASSGAVLLTFLAGAELDPGVIRTKLKEVSVVGLIGCFAPFLGCAAVARYLFGWDAQASLLSGIALSHLDGRCLRGNARAGLNKTGFGKGVLGACFVNDLGTVIALGLLFAPFTYKTVVFIVAVAIVCLLLPYLTRSITRLYAHRTAAIRESGFCLYSSLWARWLSGQAARRSFLHTLQAWSWLEAPRKTLCGFAGSGLLT